MVEFSFKKTFLRRRMAWIHSFISAGLGARRRYTRSEVSIVKEMRATSWDDWEEVLARSPPPPPPLDVREEERENEGEVEKEDSVGVSRSGMSIGVMGLKSGEECERSTRRAIR